MTKATIIRPTNSCSVCIRSARYQTWASQSTALTSFRAGVSSPAMRASAAIGLLLCLAPQAAVFFCSGLARGADWPCWRGPQRDGISAETNWSSAWGKDGPPILWKTSVGTGFSSVSVRGDRIYTMGNKDERDVVVCLDAATGREVWRHAYPAPLDAKYYEGGPSATPTLDGNRVFTFGKRGSVCCLDADTGGVFWQKNVAEELGQPVNEWGLAGSPVVEGNLLLLNVGAAGTALDKASGKVIWSSARETAGYASVRPLDVGGRRAAAVFAAKFLVLVEAASGRELWRHPWETGWDNNNADPVVQGNLVFISSYSRGCALLEAGLDTPRVVYAHTNLHNHMSPGVKIGAHLYGFNGREGRGRPNDFRCLEFLTGRVLWRQPGMGVGSLMAAGDRLVILSETGELVIARANPGRFQALARSQVLGGRCWTPPVLANGRIFCRNARGDLVCVDVH